MDEIKMMEPNEYLCNFTYKYAYFLDMPKCSIDVGVGTWAKALWLANPCLKSVWASIDEFVNAYTKRERAKGDRCLATRSIGMTWGEEEYGPEAMIWYDLHALFERTIGTKYWCQIKWDEIIYANFDDPNADKFYVQNSDGFGWRWEVCYNGNIDKEIFFNLTDHWVENITKADHKISIRWDLLKMFDAGVVIGG